MDTDKLRVAIINPDRCKPKNVPKNARKFAQSIKLESNVLK